MENVRETRMFQLRKAMSHLMRKPTIRTLMNTKIVRVLFWPYMKIVYKAKERKFRKSEWPRRLESLRGIHTDDRCFIIGNGPSLSVSDLESLHNEITFASNRIYEFFGKTVWRPSYWVCSDNYVLLDSMDSISEMKNTSCFVSATAPSSKGVLSDKVSFFLERNKYRIDLFREDIKILFSEDISKGVEFGGTVTFCAIQIAVYMGFKKIYLLGVDHNYSRTYNSDGKLQIDTSVKDYPDEMKVENPDKYTPYTVHVATRAYTIANDYCVTNGIEIYNATRGGKLEAFPRISLEEILMQ